MSATITAPGQTTNHGLTAIYLYIGAASAINGDGQFPRQNVEGHLGAMDWLASFAPILNTFYDADDRDYPGVAHYEVTEHMGQWLVNQATEPTPEAFLAEVHRVVGHWVASGQLPATCDAVCFV